MKLVKIARGVDEDFDDLHRKRLRRFHLWLMYSHKYIRQNELRRGVLAGVKVPERQYWETVWTEKELLSDRVIEEKAGWFSASQHEILHSIQWGQPTDMGATAS